MKKAKFYKSLILIFSTSILVITGCNANANGHKSSLNSIYKMPLISDIDTVTLFSGDLSYDKRSVRLSLAYEADAGMAIYTIHRSHSPEFVRSVHNKVARLMTPYLKTKGVSKRECRGSSYNLNIIVISKDVLQNRDRFRGFYQAYFGTTNPDGKTLYGYYDSTKEIPNNSTILVTNITPWLNEQVLAHELAHYWWDRLCIASDLSITSEQFAQDFQNYYMEGR